MSAASPSQPRIVLHPGDCHVSDRPVTLSTLLGSCVAVCLYDPVRRVMGMNHFLLATRNSAHGHAVLASEEGRYGIHAMELLVNGLLAVGGERRNLQAKAFGGGNVIGRASADPADFMCIGAINIRFVREFLERDRIPLVAADLGGTVGRQIHFTGGDYAVYVRAIASQQTDRLVEEERVYWRHSVEAHERERQQAEFW